jgi:hypothetical protein
MRSGRGNVIPGVIALTAAFSSPHLRPAPPRWKTSSRRWCRSKPPSRRTAKPCSRSGASAEGSGVVIDEDGLILTIGYLMVEAHAAADHHQRGPHRAGDRGRIRSRNRLRHAAARIEPLKIKPLAFGRSADVKRTIPVLIASQAGRSWSAGRVVAAKREFAGSWEYLLDEAIFTRRRIRLERRRADLARGQALGVGSLIVGDAGGTASATPGNMFVPIERLPPILGDLIADGRWRARAARGSASRRTRCAGGLSSRA